MSLAPAFLLAHQPKHKQESTKPQKTRRFLREKGLLAHLENVDDLLKQALGLAEIVRLEIHGPEQELEQLRGPLAALNPRFFTLEYGFRR